MKLKWSGIAILIGLANLLTAQENCDFLGFLPYEKELSDVWGYTDTAGAEYALVGVYDGLSIVDVSNPVSPEQLHFIPGPESYWRDIKTFQHYAYVINETDGGLLILDLGNLPSSVDTVSWQEDSLRSAHNLFIDENGVLYIMGMNRYGGGVLMLDLNADPMSPTLVGLYEDAYVHDAYVRGDTLWTAEIYNNWFAVVDVSDKANPVVLATQPTPFGFTHNCWLSENGEVLFVSEEYYDGHILAYDVRDLNDITELDYFRRSEGSGLIPHNAFVLDNYLVISYYRDGISVVDIEHPENMVEVAHYDTSPYPAGPEFNGCWGVYPYLPSGTMLATDIEEGLFTLGVDYNRAAWLEGFIYNEATGEPFPLAVVEILETGTKAISGLNGTYNTGVADGGLYDIRVTASGCITHISPNVELEDGEITVRDFALNCTSTAIDPYLIPEKLILGAGPNPFRNGLSVNYSIPQEDYRHGAWKLNIYGLEGRMQYSQEITAKEGVLQLPVALSDGLYLLRLEGPTGEKSIRISRM